MRDVLLHAVQRGPITFDELRAALRHAALPGWGQTAITFGGVKVAENFDERIAWAVGDLAKAEGPLMITVVKTSWGLARRPGYRGPLGR